MPAYEFLCKQTRHGKFEKIISFKDHKDSFPCPKCGQPSEQVISKPAAAIFRGSGFHANDYGAPTKR